VEMLGLAVFFSKKWVYASLLNGLETAHTPFKVWLVEKIEKGVSYTTWYYSRPVARPSITTAVPTADADGVVDEM